MDHREYSREELEAMLDATKPTLTLPWIAAFVALAILGAVLIGACYDQPRARIVQQAPVVLDQPPVIVHERGGLDVGDVLLLHEHYHAAPASGVGVREATAPPVVSRTPSVPASQRVVFPSAAPRPSARDLPRSRGRGVPGLRSDRCVGLRAAHAAPLLVLVGTEPDHEDAGTDR